MNCSRCSAEAVVKRDNAYYCGKCAMARDWESVIAVVQSGDSSGVVVFGAEEPVAPEAAPDPEPAPQPVAVAETPEPVAAAEPEPVAAAEPEPAPEPEPEPEPEPAVAPVAASNGSGDLPPADPFG
ncbi:MAG: hypothetical protein HKN93_04425 [Acidimicrobiia bacterium]|nr:hypothetical protein [Acidimicrobiia bacterium]